ncbi:carbohydrate-binding protein [Neobacillus niacini]|uniref:carbohydrate-binding protein n=1 Tax=Neobacillus niacini TaxID=86668 RepID=UPI000AB457E4|nr:carbohydrate-binding protein [Neobacillus niacini]
MKLCKMLSRKIVSVSLSLSIMLPNFTGVAFASNDQISPEGLIDATSIQTQIYVEVGGSDTAGDGTQGKPFATVAKAKAKVSEMIQALPDQKMTSDIIVNIGQGDYYLNEPVEFNVEDSGTNGHNVIYRSADGIGKANLIGGTKIEGWQKSTDADVAAGLLDSIKDKVYKVKLDPSKFNFNALYVNDKKAIMARTKNKDIDPRFPAYGGEYLRSVGGGMHDMNYKAGDLDQRSIDGMAKAQAAGYKEIAQVYVWDGGDWDWFTNTIPIEKIDSGSRKLMFPQDPERPELYRPKYPIGSGARYYLQGNISFLDVPGEYYYDKVTGDLYYYPKEEDGSVDQWTVVAPTMQKILYFKGDDKGDGSYADYKLKPDPLKQTHNIKIDGLTLKNTEYTNYFTSGWNETDAGGGLGTVPPESEGSTNPAYSEQTDRVEYKIGAVTMINTNNITIENTKIRNIGLFGIAMYRDNQYNTFKNIDIEFVGYGGISSDGGYPGVGKYNHSHTITNIAIHDIGQNVGHASGVTWMNTSNSDISHLEIYNSPRRAIMTSAGIRRNSLDSKYDELTDMYTVKNKYSYINIHDMQQDAGEDSAIFWVYLLRGNEILKRHGNDENVKIENGYKYYDVGPERYNYMDQVIVDRVGAHPSLRDKNTVHGMDLTMGGSGTHLSNIKVTNPQSKTMRIEEAVTQDKFHMDNVNNNYYNDNILNTFDDSRMEYDKIGLTSDFPFERYHQEVYRPDTNDMYFEDAFENGNLNLSKWNIEKGRPHINQVYMSEGAMNGKHSLATDGNKNKSGVVVSRKFEKDLNKIVEVQYFDKRQDYSGSDAGEGGGSYVISPNAFVRVDNGTDIVALGAKGDTSKDYYVYKDGDKVVTTNVERSFGWHNFKFDYSSETDVKMYIDDTLVGSLPRDSFNYIGMGDWEGKGGETYFDQVFVYGGVAAPPVEELEFPIVSLNKLATASSSKGSNTPEKANDGSASSMWSAGSSEPGSWWQVDMEQKKNIYRVDIQFNSNTKYNYPSTPSMLNSSYINVPKNITFQVSDDGSNWTTVASKVTNIPKNDSYSRNEPKPYTYVLTTSGRYLRLLFEDGAQGTDIDFKEVSVWTKDQYVMYGIKSPADQMVKGGAEKTAEALGLPKTVKLLTDGEDTDAEVNWEVESSDYDPTQKYIRQTFTVNGTVTLPSGFLNPNNVPLTTSITVTVEPFGTVEAEDYDNMFGIQTEDCSEGGKNVGWLDPGDWMEYNLNVPVTGKYKLNYRVAVNAGNTGKVNFLVDGVSAKVTSLPSTGGWQNWATVSDEVELTKGKHTIRLQVIQSGWNINKFELIPEVVDQEAPTTTDNAPTGWVNEDVTVLLNATDNGTGVASTHYIVNDGEEQTGNSVVFTKEGVHTLTYWSVDKAGNVEQRHTVTVKIDKTAPTLKIELDPSILWPANHKMVKVNATLDSSDTLSGVKSVVLTSITSNEPESIDGDIQAKLGSEDTSFSLRATRSGEGTGRVYTITYTATDHAGNQRKATATVTVPHDQSWKVQNVR